MATNLLLKFLADNAATIRRMIAPDGLQVFSAFDVMTEYCGYKDTGGTARTEFKRVVSEHGEFRDEVLTLCKYLRFPGQRGPSTPCMTIQGLQRLLIILGGKVAAKYRPLLASAYSCAMNEGQSLIEVVNANPASHMPLQQAQAVGLAQEPVSPCGVKRRERVEVEELDLELEERRVHLEETKLRLEETRLKITKAKCEHALSAFEMIETLKSKSAVDKRTQLQFEEHIKNLVLNPQAPPAAGPAADHQSPSKKTIALNVSAVVADLGYHHCMDVDLMKIGRAMAAKYRETYKNAPPKHMQSVKGKMISVNSYTEHDRPLMEQVIRKHMASMASAETESDNE
jgi:hypothetical protein